MNPVDDYLCLGETKKKKKRPRASSKSDAGNNGKPFYVHVIFNETGQISLGLAEQVGRCPARLGR